MDITPTSPQHVGLIRRLMTLVYDSFLIFACCLLSGAVVVAVKIAFTDNAAVQAMRENGERAISGPWESGLLFMVCLLTIFFFYAYFWRRTGQTLAMQAWRSKLVSSDTGQLPSWGQCATRFVVAFFSLALGGLGFVWMLVDPDKKTWHDRVSGTELQLQPKRKK
jgi:uncharacterized RDD family membrane protein YckC